MPAEAPIHLRDARLVQIVDSAMAEAVRRGGERVVCGPGCTECCHGPFAITALDAERLRRGLAAAGLAVAARIIDRCRAHDGDDEDEPCPALDPGTGLCDLYASRPLTCRVFGPAIRWGDDGAAVGACELCYHGLADEDVARLAVTVDPEGLEAELCAELGLPETSVAAALLKEK